MKNLKVIKVIKVKEGGRVKILLKLRPIIK
jgi:hypothetical protein